MARKKKNKGKVYLVGAGPGDPGLITRRGLDLVRAADVIVYDRLVNHLTLSEAPSSCRLVPARKGKYGYGADQARINRILVREARAGNRVVRLKGGDPFVYGRGAEEGEYLRRNRTDFEIVPGVTAAIGASACAGIPLTDRRLASSVTFATGHGARGTDPQLPEISKDGTLVVYMGVRTLSGVVDTLLSRGWKKSTPAAVVASASLPTQKVVSAPLSRIVAKVKKERLKPPALIIVGEVARNRFAWFKSPPLRGRSVIVTRARHQSGELAGRLAEFGVDVILYPAIDIRAPKSHTALENALRRLHLYDTLAFTSVNAVYAFFAHLHDMRLLAGKEIFAVGPVTAEAIWDCGVVPDHVAKTATVEHLTKLLPKHGRILHPCGDLANPILRKQFRCDDVVVYRTTSAKPAVPSEELLQADVVTFASSETVRQFAKMVNRKVRRIPAVCIGPVTAKTARKLGFKVVATAKPHTIEGLVQAVRKTLKR